MSFSRFLAHRALEKAVQTKAPNITLLNCMQDVMESDRDRQDRLPVFTEAVDLYCDQERHGISRFTGLASLVRNYETDNFYSRDVIAILRAQAREFHHACSGSFEQREKVGFRLVYDLFQHSKATAARDAFSTMATNVIKVFDKGEAVVEAEHMLSNGNGGAYDYLATYPLQFAQKKSAYRAVTMLLSNVRHASPQLDPATPYAAAALILGTSPDHALAEFTQDQVINYALWSLERPAEKIGGKHDAQAHMAVMLSETWIPDYAEAHGIAKAAPYAEKLYALTSDNYIKTALRGFMAPRLDLLAAEPDQLGPAAAWALRIGANTPEVTAFTERNLARLFRETAKLEDESFKTLISYAGSESLDRFAEALPTAERNAFSLLRPRSGPLQIRV